MNEIVQQAAKFRSRLGYAEDAPVVLLLRLDYVEDSKDHGRS